MCSRQRVKVVAMSGAAARGRYHRCRILRRVQRSLWDAEVLATVIGRVGEGVATSRLAISRERRHAVVGAGDRRIGACRRR